MAGQPTPEEAQRLWILAQYPPSKNGLVCPVLADSLQLALQEAAQRLGPLTKLTQQDMVLYTDQSQRQFILLNGLEGMERLTEYTRLSNQKEIGE